jgi:hypothetical protein
VCRKERRELLAADEDESSWWSFADARRKETLFAVSTARPWKKVETSLAVKARATGKRNAAVKRTFMVVRRD